MPRPSNMLDETGMASQPPKILVGIVTHNRADVLPKAIGSALTQLGCNVRVSVIDDGSTDATSEVARRFPEVEWIGWSPGRGYMAARNHWMASSDVTYFVSLDDDAWFLRGDEIALAVAFMEQNPQVAALAFDILSPDRPDSVPREAPHPAAMFIGCGHLLRLSAVRDVGVYEITPGGYGGEEKDLCLRLMNADYQIVHLPGVHVWHDKTPLARDIPRQHRSGVCNDLVMTLRRTPLLVLPLALAAKLFRHLVFSWRAGLMKPCLAGISLFARSLPEICRSRRPVKMSTLRSYLRLSRAGQSVIS